ncbi:PQQ-binding-like beta-propeller repeat protein [Agromyces sp. Root1464]|uniref:PQQ-binding-like beta-propeller repeat protein n=1 Tax=Agromyces sp. Root1464 TaxID=1736467 RepID=UPI000A832B2F|nr:PQQ-binding-like beta-propeller repeat protein [Agromyces sp. Root1464]
MSCDFSRRQMLVLGGIGGLALAFGAAAPGWAAPAAGGVVGQALAAGARIRDLGPGVVQFPLMSGLLVGDTMYIGSRNLSPARVVGFHLPTRTVTSRTDLPSGYSIQALAADPARNRLFIGMLRDSMEGANVYQWDLTRPDTPAVAIGATGDRDVRALAVAPDGKVYAAGGGEPTTASAPSLWELDPTTNTITSWGIPSPGATIAQAVAATDTTVYFGTGSVLAGGGGASLAKLFAFDRATRTPVDVLPAEFAAAVSVTSLSVLDGTLGVGLKGPGKSVLLNLANPSTYQTIARTGVLFAQQGDTVYFAKDPTVYAYSITKKTMTAVQDTDIGTLWGLGIRGDRLVAASGYSFIAAIDPATRTTTTTDLVGAGAPAGPQTAMGLAVGAGRVYVGGTGAIARHDLDTEAVTNLRTPGEQKDGVVVDGVLYSGQYNSKGLWSYDPASDVDPHQIASFPANQNRPLDVCWDPVNRLVLIATQNDTQGGGSLTAYNPATRTAASWVNPIDAQQMVRAVTTSAGVAYLGGDNLYQTGPRSTVVAWNPVTGTELWRVDTGVGAGIAALATVGDRLFGLARHGAGVFVIDIPSRTVVQTLDAAAVSTDFGSMTVSRGLVYAASDTTVFRIDPQTLTITTVVAGIDGGWYSGPHIESDEDGLLYTMRGLNVVQIDDGPAVEVAAVAEARCIGSKAYLAVKVTNAEPVPVSVKVVTPYGERTFAEVLPGRSAAHTFAVRASTVHEGAVTIEASRVADGSTITQSRSVAYSANSCG